MEDSLKISLEGDISKIERQLRTVTSKNYTLNFGTSGKNPLGQINSDLGEIDKSFAAATKRIVAFGAVVGVLDLFKRGLQDLAKSTIDVEDAFARINVNLGASKEGLQSFSQGVFQAAKDTGQSFETAAKAAEELARQGLSSEETLKRLRDALILTRISGQDSIKSVETLTAAYNTFAKAGLDTTTIVNKLAAVDTAFAVSSADLAEAISRVGSTAQDAGVNFDQLIALVTTAQQTTARGGSVIGNAFKTIFSRVSRTETLDQLEKLGIAVRDLQGDSLPAVQILKNLSDSYDKLGQAQKRQIEQQVGGLFQINILKATLSDLGNQQGIYSKALNTSVNAQDQAIQKNKQLNVTFKSLLNETGIGITQLFSSIGNSDVSQNIFKKLITQFNQILGGLSNTKAGEEGGKTFGQKFITGVTNALGPASLILLKIFGSLFKNAFVDISKFIGSIIGINKNLEVQAETQAKINALISAGSVAEKAAVANAATLAAKKEAVLLIEQRITAEIEKRRLAKSALTGEFLTPSKKLPILGVRKQSSILGNIPNYADPLATAINREKAAGVPANQIYVDSDPRLVTSQNPMGLLVANRRDEPRGGYQGVDRVLAQGGDPKKNGAGPYPNFAEFGNLSSKRNSVGVTLGSEEFIDPQDAKQLRSLFARIRRSGNLEEVDKLGSEIQNFSKSIKLTGDSFNEVNSKLSKVFNDKYAFRDIFRNGVNKFGQKSASALTPDYSQFEEATKPGTRGVGDIAGEISLRRKDDDSRVLKTLSKERNRKLIEDSLEKVSTGVALSEKEYGRIFDDIRKKVLNQSEFKGIDPNKIRSGAAGTGLQKLFEFRLDNEVKTFDKLATAAQDRAISQNSFNKARAILGKTKVGLFGDKSDEVLLANSKVDTDDASVRGLLSERSQQRSSRRATGSLIASFALPVAAGFVTEGKGGTAAGIGGGLASGALQGAGFGALFGPVGIGVGAAAGALIGVFSKLRKSTEELASQFEESSGKERKQIDLIDQFIQAESALSDAQSSGASADALDRLSKRADIAAKAIGGDFLKQIDSSGDRIKAASDFREAANNKLGDNETSKVAATSLFGILRTESRDSSQKVLEEASKDLAKSISPEFAKNLDSKKLSDVGFNPRDVALVQEYINKLKEINPVFKELPEVNVRNVKEVAQTLLKTKEINNDLVKSEKSLQEARIKSFSRTGLTSFAGVDFNNPTSGSFGESRRATINGNIDRSQRSQSLVENQAFLSTVDSLKSFGGLDTLSKELTYQLKKLEDAANFNKGKEGLLTESAAFVNGTPQFRGATLRNPGTGDINEDSVTALLKELVKSSDEQTKFVAGRFLDAIKTKNELGKNLAEEGIIKPPKKYLNGYEVGVGVTTYPAGSGSGGGIISKERSDLLAEIDRKAAATRLAGFGILQKNNVNLAPNFYAPSKASSKDFPTFENESFKISNRLVDTNTLPKKDTVKNDLSEDQKSTLTRIESITTKNEQLALKVLELSGKTFQQKIDILIEAPELNLSEADKKTLAEIFARTKENGQRLGQLEDTVAKQGGKPRPPARNSEPPVPGIL